MWTSVEVADRGWGHGGQNSKVQRPPSRRRGRHRSARCATVKFLAPCKWGHESRGICREFDKRVVTDFLWWAVKQSAVTTRAARWLTYRKQLKARLVPLQRVGSPQAVSGALLDGWTPFFQKIFLHLELIWWWWRTLSLQNLLSVVSRDGIRIRIDQTKNVNLEAESSSQSFKNKIVIRCFSKVWYCLLFKNSTLLSDFILWKFMRLD